MIKLLDVENNVVKPTVHCQLISWLKAIQDKFPKDALKIYAYLFYMYCYDEENPYLNVVEMDKESLIIQDLKIDFSLEDDVIILAKEKTAKLYETPSLRAYLGIKQALDNLADYMRNTKITGGKDGNIAQIRQVAKDFDDLRQSYKGIAQDLADEQKTSARGGSELAYDQM